MTLVALDDGTPFPAPPAAGEALDRPGRRDVGRAMRTTPRKEIRPATCSLRVKGSWIRTEQAQQVTIGARKVMTVASDRGRYSRESGFFKSISVLKFQIIKTYSQYIPYTVSR